MSELFLWRAVAIVCAASAIYVATSERDPNARPEYGKTGLPANCRAYVDASIAGYRARRFTAEEAMAGLERNCGTFGDLWSHKL